MGRHKTRRNSKRNRRPRRPVMQQCTARDGNGKVRYATEDEARSEANYWTNLMRVPMTHYSCDTCEGWHTTKKRKRQ